MKKINIDIVVGLFMLCGFAAFAYLSLQLGEFSFFSMQKNYTVVAEFDSVSGLKEGAVMEISGVKIGKVSRIILNGPVHKTIIVDLFFDIDSAYYYTNNL